MKIGEKIIDAIHQLKSQTPKYEHGNPTMIIKVNPKDKALIAFVFHLASGMIEGHYNQIDIGIRSNSFTYELQGAADEVTCIFNYKCFRDGSTLPNYFEKLMTTINLLLKNISQGWVHGAKSFFENEANYENHNIYGTYYVFLLQQIAINIGFNVKNSIIPEINALYFSTWLPIDHWSLAHHISLGGSSKVIEKFFDSLSSELKIAGDLSTPRNEGFDKEIIVQSSDGRAVVDVSNSFFAGSLIIRVSNMPRGTTFIKELTEKNHRNVNIDNNKFNESFKSDI